MEPSVSWLVWYSACSFLRCHTRDLVWQGITIGCYQVREENVSFYRWNKRITVDLLALFQLLRLLKILPIWSLYWLAWLGNFALTTGIILWQKDLVRISKPLLTFVRWAFLSGILVMLSESLNAFWGTNQFLAVVRPISPLAYSFIDLAWTRPVNKLGRQVEQLSKKHLLRGRISFLFLL